MNKMLVNKILRLWVKSYNHKVTIMSNQSLSVPSYLSYKVRYLMIYWSSKLRCQSSDDGGRTIVTCRLSNVDISIVLTSRSHVDDISIIFHMSSFLYRKILYIILFFNG